LRWDINQDANERYNRLNRGFDANAASPVAQLIDRNRFPQFANLKGGLLFAGVGGVGTRSANTDYNNFQPRVGVAFQLTPKVVIRTGWGIAYLNPSNNDLQLQGFSQSTPLVVSADGQRTFRSNVFSNPYPNGIQQPPGASLGLNTFLGQRLIFYDPNFRTPYMHQFSFGFQFDLPHSSVVEVSYVGNRTMDLESEREINELPVEARRLCNPLEGGRASYCNEQIPNPFAGLEPFRGTGHFNPTIARQQLLRPYPQFGSILMRGLNTGRIWYNSLQIQHQTRMRGGLNVLTSYVFSKQVEQWGYTDPSAGVVQRGLYFIDTPHRLTAGAVWHLPFGKGRKWGNTSHGFWSRVVSGWDLTGFYQWQSGRPWDYPGNVIPIKDAKLDIPHWNAHRVQGVRPCVGRVNSETGAVTMEAYSRAYGCGEGDFNFLINPQYAPRVTPFRSGQIRQHAAPNIDMSLNKTTQITETTRIQFRAEAFNVTNTYFWGRNVFITDPNNSNFGAYFPRDATSQNRYPRQVQLAVKFLW
jgi:hypothetical protein